MLKQHAELIAKKEQERRIDIGRLTSYPEYYVLKEELEKMVATLEKIDTLDFESKLSIEAQAFGHKLAKEKILRFLSDMGAYAIKSQDTTDKSYN
jgi:predicted GNAT family N-acyltransferase